MQQIRKYRNKKIENAYGEFDSKGEYLRWLVLLDAQQSGKIHNLRRQVTFVLLPTQYRDEVVHMKTKDKIVRRVAERPVTYVADFVYEKDGETVAEDFKGYPDDKYPIKRKLMLYFKKIAVREIKKPGDPI